jgi:hypothetical protein
MTLKEAILKIPTPDEMGRRAYESQRSIVAASLIRIPDRESIRTRSANAKD